MFDHCFLDTYCLMVNAIISKQTASATVTRAACCLQTIRPNCSTSLYRRSSDTRYAYTQWDPVHHEFERRHR